MFAADSIPSGGSVYGEGPYSGDSPYAPAYSDAPDWHTALRIEHIILAVFDMPLGKEGVARAFQALLEKCPDLKDPGGMLEEMVRDPLCLSLSREGRILLGGMPLEYTGQGKPLAADSREAIFILRWVLGTPEAPVRKKAYCQGTTAPAHSRAKRALEECSDGGVEFESSEAVPGAVVPKRELRMTLALADRIGEYAKSKGIRLPVS